jgi:putative DNA primase/helicase
MLGGVLALNVERKNFGGHAGLICVRNGTVDVHSGNLLPHSPEHELRFRLDIDYDPHAACPTYEEHIAHTLQGNQKSIDTFDEFAALTLVPDLRFQKALYLVGPGGSGKSTLLKAVEVMHDPDAISVTPLDKIDQERYLTNLARKLVCISFDVQTDKKIFGEGFIRITGGDPVTTRELYKEVEGRVVPTVRFLGSMNPDMPRFIASPDALQRRLIFLPCGRKVARPDPDRFTKIYEERSGILARWVQALRRLYDRGHFDAPQESTDEIAEYLQGQTPFDQFVAERLVADPKASTLVADIVREYNWWAQDMGEAQLSSNTIGAKLRAIGFEGGYTRVGERENQKNARVVRARIARKPVNRDGPY